MMIIINNIEMIDEVEVVCQTADEEDKGGNKKASPS